MRKELYRIFKSLEPITKQIQKNNVTQYELYSVTPKSTQNEMLSAIHEHIEFIRFPQYGYLSLPRNREKIKQKISS